MKTIITIIFACFTTLAFAQVNEFEQPLHINETGAVADPSAALDVSSTTKGVLISRMTTAQRIGISSPADGLMVYDTDQKKLFIYDGLNWTQDGDTSASNELQNLSILGSDLTISGGNTVTLPSSGSGLWESGVGSTIYYDAGHVGIGTTASSTSTLNLAQSTDQEAMKIVNSYSGSQPQVGLDIVVQNGSGFKNGLEVQVISGSSTSARGIYSFLEAGTTGIHRSIEAIVNGAGTAVYGKANLSSGKAAEFDGAVNVDGRSRLFNIGGIALETEGLTALNNSSGTALQTDGLSRLLNPDDDALEVEGKSELSNPNGDALITDGNVTFNHSTADYNLIKMNAAASSSGDSTGIYFSEDNDGSFGMTIFYDGANNKMNWTGQSLSTTFGPHMTMERNTGDVEFLGDVAIGGTDMANGFALSVNGKAICEELQIDLMTDWPDYVFEDDYELKSLEETNDFIETHGHLPGIPSAAEVEENGISVGDMQKRMMEKIEELTLHMIRLNEENKELKKQLDHFIEK